MTTVNDPLDQTEQEILVSRLRGPQFDRKRHGGLWDRGTADSYYGRPAEPHWWPQGTGHGTSVTQLNKSEIAEYMAGYDWNERYGHIKAWD